MALAGKELGSFLEEPHLAHFATVGPDGKPRVRPPWFSFAEGALWFTTRLEARRTGADVVAGSSVAVSIASENARIAPCSRTGIPRCGRPIESYGSSGSRRGTA